MENWTVALTMDLDKTLGTGGTGGAGTEHATSYPKVWRKKLSSIIRNEMPLKNSMPEIVFLRVQRGWGGIQRPGSRPGNTRFLAVHNVKDHFTRFHGRI